MAEDNIKKLTLEIAEYHRERGLLLGDMEIAMIINDRIEQGKWTFNQDGFLVRLK